MVACTAYAGNLDEARQHAGLVLRLGQRTGGNNNLEQPSSIASSENASNE